MGRRSAFAVLMVLVLSPAVASSLQAQRRPLPVRVVPPLTALALNDLSFGTVLPGIPVSVSPNDPRHCGQFEIRGPADASVRVDFTLPAALASGAALLPIAFGGGDGLGDFSHDSPPRSIRFDPHMPLIATIGPNGMFFLRLGGTVSPSPTQSGGAYSATISITVYNLGS